MTPTASKMSTADQGQHPARTRRLIMALVLLQIVVPAVMLGLRIGDPSLGQLPFGWQMHTSCWGAEPGCRR